ncbi:methionyl-tRNA formyltransferase [Halarcobacter ebronensis]|uniref:Methionyl-tRNA formyltransferase n=1 Tax=Halarcobacter ebronensis TaxID=1462615 RepID=A0A4Q0YH02_9BACT|nr:formyltransferase family protein [Halarcobacter ebronensis]RXJ68984.1 methionyl-tRNA formyltransferase [Halarcobacter ebronensis]
MKIVFIGTVEFSRKALQKLIEMGAEIVGVCTKKRSDFNSDFVDITPLCKENEIPFRFVENINEKENINWIASLSPDIIFCFGWSSLIKKELLELPPMGVIGYHPAKLPYNRGRHPLIWTLVLGLDKSASTFFFMDESADSGDILSQKDFEVFASDTAKILYDRVIGIALEQIEDFVPQLQKKNYQRIQQDNSLANIWRKRGQADGKIDFRMSSQAIYNLVRALSKPYIGAHLEYNGKNINIWRVRVVENSQQNIEFGKVLDISDNKVLVKTYDGAIEIIEHQFTKLPTVGEYL